MAHSEFNSQKSAQEFEALLADMFLAHGWKVNSPALYEDIQPDLVVSQGRIHYVVELKVASEGRKDRLVPLLAQAILQANAIAKRSPTPVRPMAVVAAPEISQGSVSSLREFLYQNAPDAEVGILDREGLRVFIGDGLESLNAEARHRDRRMHRHTLESANLFSDLNQWMLKVLLAPLLPRDLLSAPRGEYQNASDLAEAANVSVMSAFRLVRQLRQDGFLDSGGVLRLVRRAELLHLWQAAHLRSVPELPLRWILPKKNSRSLWHSLHGYRISQEERRSPRFCLGLFSAADELGLGFVHGAPQSFYLEKLDRHVLADLGLSSENAERSPDVFVRVPSFRESVFRGAVTLEGVPVADALQIWLDVSSHPSRGKAQAEEIQRRALKPIFQER